MQIYIDSTCTICIMEVEDTHMKHRITHTTLVYQGGIANVFATKRFACAPRRERPGRSLVEDLPFLLIRSSKGLSL